MERKKGEDESLMSIRARKGLDIRDLKLNSKKELRKGNAQTVL